MRDSGRFTSWAILGAMLFRTGLAHADDTPKPYPPCDRSPSDADVSGAKGAFDAGQASFNEADYSRAIEMWEDAYRRDCTAHRLLLNLARAYELNNQKRRAVVALQTYVTRNPGTSDESQIQRRIEKLQEQINAEAPAPTPGPAPAPVAPAPAAPRPAAPPSAAPVEQPAAAGSATGSRPIGPLIVAGGGGAVAIVGAILFFSAASDVSNYEKQCPGRVCSGPGSDSLKSDANSARTRENVSGVVSLVGLAAAAGGVLWYFLEPPSSPSASGSAVRPFHADVAPALAPGYGGVAVNGVF